jgi:ADP-heptose:LPS heptosyltransferase
MNSLPLSPQNAMGPMKAPSLHTQKQFGIDLEKMHIWDTLDQLRQNVPGMVIAEASTNLTFLVNYYKKQTLKKKVKYVMSLGLYSRLATHENAPGKKFLKPAAVKFINIYKPYRGQDLSGKTLLVWRTGGIGDLLFIQPNLLYLKEKYPDCKILFACNLQYQPMLEGWDCIDEILDLPFTLSAMLKADYHVIFEGVIERTHEAERENCYRLFTHWMGLNLPDELLQPKQTAKQECIEEAQSHLDRWGLKDKPFIVIQISASSPIRTPHPNVWKNIINELIERGHNIVLTDSPHKAEMLDQFIATLKDPTKVFNFASLSKTLDISIGLTSLATLVVATDSAFIHIGASLGKPVMGLYGPFPGYIRLDTYPKEKRDWLDCKTNCSPCYQHSPNPCRYSRDGYSTCYDTINIKEFVDKAEALLNAKKE